MPRPVFFARRAIPGEDIIDERTPPPESLRRTTNFHNSNEPDEETVSLPEIVVHLPEITGDIQQKLIETLSTDHRRQTSPATANDDSNVETSVAPLGGYVRNSIFGPVRPRNPPLTEGDLWLLAQISPNEILDETKWPINTAEIEEMDDVNAITHLVHSYEKFGYVGSAAWLGYVLDMIFMKMDESVRL